MAGEAEAPLKVRQLQCTQCGAPITLRGMGQTETVACGSCGAILDAADENLRVLATFGSRAKIEPLIPLGTRGTLFGEKLEVIGYLRRKVVVEGMPYEWGEYLLWNPYKGFRWLNEYNGHWTYIRTLMERPPTEGGRPQYLGRSFKHFQSSNASVTYVIGEFFWRVGVGERANVDDYVSPPYMLSREATNEEIVWSLGQYLDRDFVWKAFGMKSLAPFPVGVAPCQPRPLEGAAARVYTLFFWFFLAAFAVQMVTAFTARNQRVFQRAYSYDPHAAEKSFVSEPFDIPGRTSNVVVKSHADVSNDWIYLNLALIDEASGHAYDFGREISYYSGSDSDGSWSEGNRDDSAVIAAVPPGTYYLRVEPENGGGPATYSIAVYRDVPRWSFFFCALAALSVIPAFVFWRRASFEIQRWSESDHPIINYESDDD